MGQVQPVRILNVWTPEIIENGTQSSAIVDCEYVVDDQDIRWQLHQNILLAVFKPVDPKSLKMTVKSLAILRFWDLQMKKLLVKC